MSTYTATIRCSRDGAEGFAKGQYGVFPFRHPELVSGSILVKGGGVERMDAETSSA